MNRYNSAMNNPNKIYDIFIVGGGINGVGIACDAAGRGLSVGLCEKSDLAAATSSWSSKLIHGGLRYLETYDFKLVRRALIERETLMQKAPFLIHPLEFVLPHDKHLRPTWMIRMGLFLYDHLAKRKHIPGSKQLNCQTDFRGKPLKNTYKKAFSYYDCRVDDSRLVVLNAMAAHEKGADIFTRHECIEAKRVENVWLISIRTPSNEIIQFKSKVLINATGPWVADFLNNKTHTTSHARIKLVKGSHIIVNQLYEGKHAYILQNPDNRIVFAIPYLNRYTLIGTTDVPYTGSLDRINISPTETQYLCDIINRYFNKQITPKDVVSDYSGVRPLYDDGRDSPSKTTRDYHFEIEDHEGSTPLLSIFGGKLTTYRKLAEHALEKLKPYCPPMGAPWTADAKLPGGNLAGLSYPEFMRQFKDEFTWLPIEIAERYVNQYGELAYKVIGDAKSLADLGDHHGAGLYENEVRYLKENEWAESMDDILWRRTKYGLLNSQ